MASQRRAPTKRPPRPAAKKPPPPGVSEGADAAESVKTKSATKSAPAATKSGSSGAAKSGSAPTSADSGGARPAAAKSGSGSADPVATKSGSGTGTATAAPKKAAGPGAPKPGTSGPNYRPPTGATRSAARRPPPPPRRKKPKITKRTIGGAVALALVASLVVFFALAVNSGSGNTSAINKALAGVGPEQVDIPNGQPLGSVDSARYPQTIDGIHCQATEQVVYHIHAHLTIFVNGQARQVPYGIGIAPPLQFNTTSGTFVNGGTCFYWLHTHAADGIMHIESPTQTTYNLGQFFDVWGQPLNSGQVGPASGKVTVFVDGKPYTGDPRLIPLATHTQVQLDVGSPAPPQTTITFPSGL